MICSEGGELDEIGLLHLEMGKLRGRQYFLPDGNVGKRFVNRLASEIEKNVNGLQHSERQFLFTALILQRKKSVHSGKDIRDLLKRRMDMWEEGKLKLLMDEAKKCGAQFPVKYGNEDMDIVFRTFDVIG